MLTKPQVKKLEAIIERLEAFQASLSKNGVERQTIGDLMIAKNVLMRVLKWETR